MLDVDTFLTTLYVMVDDFCHSHPQRRHPGPQASLSPSEVATLAIFARWARFGSERDFYRYADTKLRGAFPTLPDRSQFNRSVRHTVGLIYSGPYVADKGFEGEENHIRWLQCYGARIIHPPKRNSTKRSWPKPLRKWVAAIRQIIETVYDKLFNTFGLWRERPHELEGLRARLAARVALHNFCIWLNDQLGRPRLAFAHLLGW